MYRMMTRKGFTLIELLIVLVIGAVALYVLIGGGSWLLSGCGAQMDDTWVVNPLHTSTVQIRVATTYFGVGELANTYRVYAFVLHDTDEFGRDGEEPPRETFEISDSFIDGNYRTADLFGELRVAQGTSQMFEIETRGDRSGIAAGGSFRQIRSVVAMGSE